MHVHVTVPRQVPQRQSQPGGILLPPSLQPFQCTRPASPAAVLRVHGVLGCPQRCYQHPKTQDSDSDSEGGWGKYDVCQNQTHHTATNIRAPLTFSPGGIIYTPSINIVLSNYIIVTCERGHFCIPKYMLPSSTHFLVTVDCACVRSLRIAW